MSLKRGQGLRSFTIFCLAGIQFNRRNILGIAHVGFNLVKNLNLKIKIPQEESLDFSNFVSQRTLSRYMIVVKVIHGLTLIRRVKRSVKKWKQLFLQLCENHDSKVRLVH